jgi:hypothetical protein
MIMPVMHIWIMRVGVLGGLVHVRMGMRLLALPVGVMVMLMMGVMQVRVFVLHT